MAWICGKDGTRKCEVKKLSYNGTFMDVSSITVTVESPVPIDFAIGDYIEWDYDGLRYTLDTAAGVEKQARKSSYGAAFVYENLVFLSPLKAADNVDFLDVAIGNTVDFMTNTEFSFYGTAWDYAKRLEANLCRLYGAGSWKVRIWTGGACYDAAPASGIDTGAWENKLVDVSGIKCLAGFQQIYDLWGCAYVFNVSDGVNYVDFYDDFELYAKTRQQGGVDKIFAYGKGNGLYKIRHTPDADHVLVTRLRAYGSSDNLPANYYLNSPDYHVDGNESSELAISRLMLPASQWTKDGVKHPSNAYLEQNTDLYGVREGIVCWDGSDTELGEIKPTIYGLTIQELLDLMAAGAANRPVEAKWPDTTQRIDKIITGAVPTDNGAVAESGYDFTVTESTGTFAAHSFGALYINKDVDFRDLVMGTTPSVSHLAEFRIVPTSENKVAVSFDVPDTFVSSINDVTAYINPYVGGVKIGDTTFPCFVSDETIDITSNGIHYTKRYKISLLDSAGNPIVFSTMYTGAVTFHFVSHIDFHAETTPNRTIPVIRNEYAVSFNLLRGNKAIDKFFSVTIPQIGFDLAAAVTGSAKLCMRSGANQPREFQIVPASVRYMESTDTWYLRCKRVADQSTSTYFPNSDAVIAAGDEYYFTGIAMPSLYVEIAAQKLLRVAKAWLKLHSKPRMLSSVDVDNKIMVMEGIVLKEGMSLPISDTDLDINPDSQESRVIDNIRIEEGSSAIRTFSITLRDKKEKSSLDAAIRGATSNFATNSSVSEAVSAFDSRDHDSLSGRDMPNQHPISAITGLEDALAALMFFEKDGNGNIKLKDEYGGLWAAGFITAGGIGSGGGGGSGGIDLDRVWQSLTNAIADSHASDLIALAHIPDLSISKIAGLQSALDAKQDTISDLATIRSQAINGNTAYGWGNHATAGYQMVSDAKEVESSISAGIASVASRVSSIEEWLLNPSIDAAYISSLSVDSLNVGGNDIADSLSALNTAISNEASARSSADTALGNSITALQTLAANLKTRTETIEGRFDANGNANSALRLTSVSKTAWGQTYWTSGGVPDSISGNMTGVGSIGMSGAISGATTIVASGLGSFGSLSLGGVLSDSTPSILEWDNMNKAWKLTGNFYATGFVSAGGIGSGGGSGSGIDLDRVWQSLTNSITDGHANDRIAVAHIPSLDWSKITTGKPTTISGYGIIDAYTKTQADTAISDAIIALNLGAASKYNVGSVASGNTGLVTGGAVYSAINTAISSAIKFQGITTTALTNGATTNPITIDGNTYTANRGDEVIYGGREFLWTGSKWQQLGDEESWALKTIQIIAGTGLTGGGTLEANRTISLATSGVTAGTYKSVTVDVYGRVTAGKNPTTLSGYGITDAQPLDADLTAIAGLAGTSGFLKKTAANTWVLDTNTYLTSVAFADLTSHPTTISGYGITDAKFGTAGSDYVPITLGSTAKNVLTAHQSLSAYQTVADTRAIEAALSQGIASVSGRVSSIEDWIESPSMGDAYISLLNAEDVNLAGSSLVGTIARFDSYFTNGVANSSLRLSGASAYSIWGIEYWASGVPKSVTGRPNLYLARTQVDTSAANDTLLGVTAISNAASSGSSDSSRIEWDTKNNAWHVYGNLYADGAITAGGIGSGGGGTSGVDLDRVWQSLTNSVSDSHASDKIAVAHIPITVNVGTTRYTPNSAGAIAIPAYPTTLPASDVSAWAKKASLELVDVPTITNDKLAGNIANNKLANSAITIAGTSVSLGGSISADTILSALDLADVTLPLAEGISGLCGRLSSVENWITQPDSDVAFIRLLNTEEINLLGNILGAVDATMHWNGSEVFSAFSQSGSSVSLTVGGKARSVTLSSIPNAALANSAITINGSATSLGGSFNTGNITAGTAGRNSATSGTTIAIPYLTMNKYGIVTAYGTHDHTISQSNIFGSTAIGSATLPVFYNGSGITACTASSVFSVLSSSAATNLSVTVAGQVRTITNLYATYDAEGNNIATNTKNIEASLASGIANVNARITSLEDWLTNPSLEELFVTDLNVQNTINGNAATATTLRNTRTIWGQNFNGSANVTGAMSSVTNINSLLYFSSGNIGVGQSSPAYKLDVNGTFRASGNSVIGGTLGVTGNVGIGVQPTSLHIQLDVVGNARISSNLLMHEDGEIHFDDDNEDENKLYYDTGEHTMKFDFASASHFVSGLYSDSYITAGASASSSDARMKDDIELIYSDRSLSVLMQLRPKEWTWNDKNSYLNGKRGAGLVAQDIEPILPFAVIKEGNYMALNYNVFHAYEIAGLQNHERRIAELERKLNEKCYVYGK